MKHKKSIILLICIAFFLNPIYIHASNIKVFIDPGHGGKDSGAQGYGISEKDVVLDIALKAAETLSSKYSGVDVKLSRTTDEFIELEERARLANEWSADYFVSIHNNAFNGTANGFESYVYNGTISEVTKEKQNQVHSYIANSLGVNDRGKKSANFSVLRNSNMPAVLLELLFIDNPAENSLLAKKSYRDYLGDVVANSVAIAYDLTPKELVDTIVITENTNMYSNPSASSKKVGSLTPQTLKVMGTYNDWYQVKTWLGYVWVRPSILKAAEVSKIDKPIVLTEVTSLYKSPINSSKTSLAIKPQTVKAKAQWRDWYKIDTWLGERWIKPTNAIVGEIQSISETIYLTEATSLYELPTNIKKTKQALKPQNVKAIAKWEDWYKINTWLGERWIKPTNAIIGEIETVQESVTLTKPTSLYEIPIGTSKTKQSLNPQTVKAVAKWKDWYKINTWLGERWIKPDNAIIGEIELVKETITLSEVTTLYNLPMESGKTKNAINPQTIKSVAKWKDWYKINTWLGERWIKPNNAIIGEIELVKETITLSEVTTLYNLPMESGKTKNAINPQTIKTIAKWGNWYKISTWLGEKWIKPNNAIFGEIIEIQDEITLTENTTLYDFPIESSRLNTTLAPQTVFVKAKWENWYKIKTDTGDKWITPTNAIIGKIAIVNETILLTEVTPLHRLPLENNQLTQALNPQEVRAIAKWENWYKVKTWLGDLWIKLN